MTSTVDPSAPTEAQPRAALARAEGIELLGEVRGSGYQTGAALVRRPDGQMVQLGPLMYALLEELDGRRSTKALADALCDRLGRPCDEEVVVGLAQKLAAQGLLAGSEQNAPPRRNPLLALRWKVLITSPRVTRALTAPFTFLFAPWIVVPVVAAFAVVFWFVLLHKGLGSATSQAFDSPGLLLLVFGLAVASAALHELGHAAACRYGGATPGGMGAGIYLVWPAFYTDVTDAYRLPRRDRLRVDLGGLYFNALIAVVTTGVWLLWRRDALLLLVALQFLMMVKNLSPVIRSDGYHILSDATGISDLYAHIGPTLRRLLPWRRREPSALTGRARLLVTLWVLVVTPVLISLMLGAIVLLPRLLTSAWDSGRQVVDAPHHGVVGALAMTLRLIALALPVVGSALVTQRVLRELAKKSASWSEGRPVRRALVVATATATAAVAAWALWPAGQYQAVRPTDRATLTSFATMVASPAHVARPSWSPARVTLAPGTHLALTMIPHGGATKAHPALFVIPGDHGKPAIALLLASTHGSTTFKATSFPFQLPSAPGPGDNQALAVNTQDGGVVYDVAYSLVTVQDGAPVGNINSAWALASCSSCTTVAVAFQIVLIVGESKEIAPINAAVAANGNCPACMTTAIADQLVVTLIAQPTQDLLDKLEASLQKLNALSELGANGTPAAVAAQVAAVQKEIVDTLNASGLLAKPIETTPTATTPAPAETTTAATTTTTQQQTQTTPTTTSQSTQTTPSTTTAPAPTTAAPVTTTTETTTPSTTTTETTPTTTAETTTTTPVTTTTAGG